MKFNVDDLIEKKLVYSRTSPCGKYRLLKYTRKVFYDNLWHLDPRLLECRGIVVDADDNVIMHPFTKVFNYGENETGKSIPLEKEVTCVRKINGYLAQAQMIDGDLLVTSSGSFTSEHSLIAKEMIKQALESSLRKKISDGYTLMFEICHHSDPHIVPEAEGVYLIGIRSSSDLDEEAGEMFSEHSLDNVAHIHGFMRPDHSVRTFGKVVELSRKVTHEGFMVRDVYTGETLVKLKSKHYLNKKALMRIGHAQLDVMFDNPTAFKETRLEEEFYGIYKHILNEYTKEEYRALTEQDRRKLIEDYFNENVI